MLWLNRTARGSNGGAEPGPPWRSASTVPADDQAPPRRTAPATASRRCTATRAASRPRRQHDVAQDPGREARRGTRQLLRRWSGRAGQRSSSRSAGCSGPPSSMKVAVPRRSTGQVRRSAPPRRPCEQLARAAARARRAPERGVALARPAGRRRGRLRRSLLLDDERLELLLVAQAGLDALGVGAGRVVADAHVEEAVRVAGATRRPRSPCSSAGPRRRRRWPCP